MNAPVPAAPMSAPLSRHRHRSGPALSLTPDITLPLARLHEGCGAARRSFATWIAGRMQGAVFWIAPSWQTTQLHPDGLSRFAEPGRFTFITPERPIDILWCMEEALRSGLVPLVVADLPEPPGLTPVRRLHLAAETGAREGAHAPLGLILTPGTGGAPGVESRWQMDPAHETQAQRWQLRRLRARTAPVRDWQVSLDGTGFSACHPTPDFSQKNRAPDTS